MGRLAVRTSRPYGLNDAYRIVIQSTLPRHPEGPRPNITFLQTSSVETEGWRDA